MAEPKHLGDAIRMLRVHQELSLRDVADTTGLTPTRIGEIERGVSKPATRAEMFEIFHAFTANTRAPGTMILVLYNTSGARLTGGPDCLEDEI